MFYFTYSHKQKNTNITDIREHANVVLETNKKKSPVFPLLLCTACLLVSRTNVGCRLERLGSAACWV